LVSASAGVVQLLILKLLLSAPAPPPLEASQKAVADES
jgi:hypothetical protein